MGNLIPVDSSGPLFCNVESDSANNLSRIICDLKEWFDIQQSTKPVVLVFTHSTSIIFKNIFLRKLSQISQWRLTSNLLEVTGIKEIYSSFEANRRTLKSVDFHCQKK